MLKGISHFQIENVIKKIDDGNLNNDFVGVFPADWTSQFINFKQMILEKTAKYPFLIANTDNLSKKAEHWWSILYIESKKKLVFFFIFDIEGLKNFIITDDKKQSKKY